jgi:hypothetical protein
MKPSSRGTEIDTEKCVSKSGGNRYDMVLSISQQARTLHKRTADRAELQHSDALISAMLDVQNGTVV